MICPNKGCNAEIPDDSNYCDQCGIRIGRCEKCGNTGKGNVCGKCGGKIIFKTKEPVNREKVQQKEKPQNQRINNAAPQETIIQELEIHHLIFCHTDGWEIELKHGDILGRSNGNHVDRFGNNSFISGTHANISFENGFWYIIDLGSSNGTTVGSTFYKKHGVQSPPMKLQDKGIVQLADWKFIVRIV
ncbi:hypothetical protein FACS1894109_07590 [Spirochaetia bacterium]|nr:hypothetical protein FACS1894109_07590 [Spirochaetia bacterium]